MIEDPRHTLGRWGEDLAACYLEKHGLTIVRRGYRCRFGEIDIIARNCATLVFCEVKTRRRATFAEPQEFVTRSKQRRLIKTAGWYLNQWSWDGGLRFDVIGILAASGQEPQVEWIQDAFSWEY